MKLLDILDVLRKGTAVADPAAWKTRSASVLVVTGFIMALVHAAKGFGYDLPIDEMVAGEIALVVVIGVGLWNTYATSPKVGLLPAKRDVDGDVLPEAGSEGVGSTVGPRDNDLQP